MSEKTNWKVGELAKQTGLSVRTLHYYDQIGLLVPSRNKGNGHRLYTETNIVRLQQIVALKQLGFPLDEIKGFLQSTDYSPGRVINLHIGQLREHIKSQQNLCRQLEIIAESLQSQNEVTAEQFIEIIEAVKSTEKCPLAREQENIRKHREERPGQETNRQTEQEWHNLQSYAVE
ncbi:MAG: MerR family transcriptional regulator [Desulfotomaculaceae bacterium]|nr:MerR family transcriptional regulator [Desulfotomaculaceae bacterium]